MEIRRADGGDVEAIRRVAERSWDTDYPPFLTRETISDGIEEWYSHDSIRADLANPRSSIFVAEHDGEVVGFVQTHRSDRTGHVLRLYVDPHHSRSGVGTALYEAAVETMSAGDIDVVRAMALAANERGCAFYRALGLDRVDTDTTTISGERYEEAIFERAEDQ
ncbi:Acetyltransferase (GNAT) family [Halanaeroarchaeum sp. HSR-CO]|uniref:GNAT family N-acetyltransferase n=1 Tax=Halanaeroarchaeum sp. HSR-CO TaxID=2866382 RepID=UPI00217D70ED|nr:GNAT family N-acetyltransferase [Halanaeroarchaeum sp. HSR-CO]UWG48585.1 Acetyltransferase (GNAT) family [Halanaeroarchaeum sp. HSR-CO]